MAGLFKNKIIKERLEKFEIPDFEAKLDIVKSWHKAYQSGTLQEKTETQCEQAFNADFFIKVLGYSSFPNEIYTIQPKDRVETKGGQIPDATLGYFEGNTKRVVAVVEIKDANTSLDKSQHRQGNMSPIQQGFKYKPQFKECAFVIVTNFVEIRLFRDNQLDYEAFTLDQLVDPKDDYFQFRKFYYLLSSVNFVTEKGQTETEKLLSAIRIEQEKITNTFYKEYRKLREDLILDIVKSNSGIKRHQFYTHVVEKAQKIIDRIVFVNFFEDSGLLPEGRLMEVVKYAQSGALEIPVWDVLKQFFAAVDKGSEKLGVPDGYNGELFKEDGELNRLKISDEICQQFVEMGRYDFEEDLSVHILGHIFEQSITDLERLKSYADESGIEQEKKDSRRKKDGIYYTPGYIVDYIVKNSVGTYLEEKEQGIIKEHKVDSARIKKDQTYNERLVKAYTKYQEILRNIKVLDPACGSGAFLVRVFDFLLEENKRVARILAEAQGATSMSLLDTEDYVRPLLQNNIYGVDLNPESVEITKLSLWLKTAKRGQKLVTLKDNIKCGNSLIDSTDVAPERAFKWETEFEQFMKGGFDVVVGNPPYVLSRETMSADVKAFLSTRYKLQRDKPNLYLLFIEKSLELVKDGGRLGFIVPNSWLGIDSAVKLREYILGNLYLENVLSLSGEAFKDVAVEASIFVVKKGVNEGATKYAYLKSDFATFEQNEINQDEWFNNRNHIIDLMSAGEDDQAILKKLVSRSRPLGELYDVRVGLQAYEKGKGKPPQTAEDVKNHVFDYDHKYDNNTYKYLQGGDVVRYFYSWSGMWLRWGEWLSQPKSLEQFSRPRVLIREITSPYPKVLNAVYLDTLFLNNKSIINVLEKTSDFKLRYLLAVLNSPVISFWHVRRAVKGARTLFPKVVVADVNAYPIPEVNESVQAVIEEKTEKIQIAIARFFDEYEKQSALLRQELDLKKLPKKLSNFHKFSFENLVEDYGKKLSLEKKSELYGFFKEKSGLLANLENDILLLENEINKLIFDTYGLSEAEIQTISRT